MRKLLDSGEKREAVGFLDRAVKEGGLDDEGAAGKRRKNADLPIEKTKLKLIFWSRH